MEKLHFRYYTTNALIGLVVFLGFGIGWFTNWLKIQGHFVGISTVGTIGLFLFVIDKYLWKYSVLKWLVWIPDLNGRYEGTVKFFHPISQILMEKNCTIEIIQTASKIKVNSYFEHSDNSERTISRSKIESIVKNEDDTFSIVLTYENSGIVGNSGFPPHYGTNILNIIINDEGTFLKGEYYTSREPQTKGTMDVKFISKKLKNHF